MMLLLGYAAVVSAAAPAVLTRAGWAIRAPRLAIAAWSAAAASVVVAFVLAAVIPAVIPQATWRAMCDLWQSCMTALRGDHGWTGQIIVLAGLGLAAAVIGRMVFTVARSVPAAMRWRRRHVEALRLIGRTGSGPDVTVIDHPNPAAYVVAARPRSLVVVTSGAVERLTDTELAAVIAHERAHAAGRHHLLITALRLLAEAFPASPLFARAHIQVSRLAEVCADDAAVRQHSRLDLARALVTVAEGLASGNRAPAAALAATGGDAAGRIRRLLAPPEPPRPWIRWAVATAVIALPVAPLAVAALARWSSTLAACPMLFR
jgi:Zn-dependent protease with chaperone function